MIARAVVAFFAFVLTAAACAQSAQSKRVDVARQVAAERNLQKLDLRFNGDFDAMLERRMIRVAAPYSRSLFYIDRGRERGIGAALVRDFEVWLNRKYEKQLGKRPLTIYLVAVTRDRLLPEVTEGLADIAIGNLTITEAREKVVDFVAPDSVRRVNEIVVTGPASPSLTSLGDLSGKTVHVRRSSSYYDSLVAENEKFKAAGKPAIKLVLVPDALEDEDMMEMVNAGLLPVIVVDDWKATMWSKALPKIQLHDKLALREGGKLGWAIRKGSPQLKAELEEFYTSWVKKNGVVAYLLGRAMHSGPLRDPASADAFKRFDDTVALFAKYGHQYGFDPVMLAAQGFQESTLDQSKRSRVGAIGVMQLMPATGKAQDVGDITAIEPNIHAGAKYMDELSTKYFADAKFDQLNKTLFAFASYNAGPANIARMREDARKRRLDPDKWFNNVEIVTAEKIGLQTTTYVRNIFKYYTAYVLVLAAEDRAAKARETLQK